MQRKHKPQPKERLSKSTCGTPQGGVLSPLLANVFLHELDKAFHTQEESPRCFANARLVRYADDFVIMAKYIGPRITDWVEEQVANLKLTMNTEKTKVVNTMFAGQSLDFLGMTLRYDKDRFGRNKRYLNTFPSKKAVIAHRAKLRDLTSSGYRRSIRDTIAKVNEVNRGWKQHYADISGLMRTLGGNSPKVTLLVKKLLLCVLH